MTPTIAPIADGLPRPFWSVMIPAYNPDPAYLTLTVRSVLEQDPGPDAMEIVVVDDGSSGADAWSLRDTMGIDRVSWVPQARHAGIGANWNACLQRARGEWVHILHQDDLVLPGFYQRLRDGISKTPSVGAAFCRDTVIDPQGRRELTQPLLRPTAGILTDWIERVCVGLYLRASALVVRRDVYETVGGFRLDLRYALDWDMWKRIAAAFPLWYEPEVLACYRRHARSASATFIRSGANIAEIRRSIELSEAQLQPAMPATVGRQSRQYYTQYAVLMAGRALLQREFRGSLAQLREARKLTSMTSVMMAIGRALPGALRARSSQAPQRTAPAPARQSGSASQRR